MSLQGQLNADLVLAMKAKDETRISTLRLLQSAIKNVEIEKRGARNTEPLTDTEVQAIIAKQVKQRHDAATQYRAGGREELATKEEAERAILEAYLPTQLSDEELTAIAKEAITATGATGPKDMGRAMAMISPQTRGRADGARVSGMVKKLLAVG